MKGLTNALGNVGLIINVIADDGTFMDGQVVTIAKKETATPDYNAIDEYGVAIMDIDGKFYQTKDSWQAAGKPTTKGIAVSDGTHRFCIAKTMVEHVCSTDSNRDSEYWGALDKTVSGVTTTTDSTTAMQDFNGVANTDAIIANVTSSDGYFTKSPWSAAGLCRQYTFPDGSNGYLGACGEWKLVQNKISEVNTLMLTIGGVLLDVSSYPYYWSSTQYNTNYAWFWNFKNASYSHNNKISYTRVRAFSEIKPITTEEPKEYIVKNGMVSIPVEKDTEYIISVNDKADYITPLSVTYNTSTGTRHITLQYIYNPVIDLSMLDIYGNPIAQTTANCYVVNKPGKYRFPCVYGNMITNGRVNFAAITNNGGANSHDFVNAFGYGITYTDIDIDIISNKDNSSPLELVLLSIADTDNVFDNITLILGSFSEVTLASHAVEFNILSIPETGANGVISIKTSEGTIVWSWHIWVWPYDLTPVEITNATGVTYNILPVNLATKLDTADSINKTTGWKNWFYQFGRPTPMLCPSAYNSTKNPTIYGTVSFAAASIASDIQTGIKNPTTFYKNNSSYNYNWFKTNSGKTYNLWDAACISTGNSDNNVVKTIYDPCPVGFKIPNGNTFTYFSNPNVVGNFANGWKFKRYSGDTAGIFFPASGYRGGSNGSLGVVGSNGYIWLSSASSQSEIYYLYFDSGDVSPHVTSFRSYGFSVRPVEDDNIQLDVIMISFTIAGTTYQAESGMTWFEWVNSEYNTDGYITSGLYVYFQDENIILDPGTIDDNIIGGNNYRLVRIGAGGSN